MQLPSSDHTVLASSNEYRQLIGTRDTKLIHAAPRNAKWTPPKECFGGMGGNPDGGYQALCGVWGLWLWNDKQRGERQLCSVCQDTIRQRARRQPEIT